MNILVIEKGMTNVNPKIAMSIVLVGNRLGIFNGQSFKMYFVSTSSDATRPIFGRDMPACHYGNVNNLRKYQH